MGGAAKMNKTLNFSDIIRKNILNLDAFQKISPAEVLTCVIFTLIAAIFIFLIYKYTFRGVIYNYTFNLALVPMCVVTALVILTISSNVVLSLGMVGALSIVRFRTALKDPMDIVYMFWALGAGIASGAGIYSVSLLGSLLVGIILLVMSRYKLKDKKFMLILHYTEHANDGVKRILGKISYNLKAKTITKDVTELSAEVKVKGDNTAFLSELSGVQGVIDASLVSYNGDYAE
jgi:uncharacterized membrane protein YhiD involved in acid resistance